MKAVLIISLVALFVDAQLSDGYRRGLLKIGSRLLASTDLLSSFLPASQLLNCSTPGTIYPLLNSCRGWYMCGLDSMAYRFSCGTGNCYNATSKRCDIPFVQNNRNAFWFNCSEPGTFQPWNQTNTVYGFCFSADAVGFLNKCQEGTTFSAPNQACQEGNK